MGSSSGQAMVPQFDGSMVTVGVFWVIEVDRHYEGV